MSGLESDLRRCEVLVLNGDIFDFRWSTLGGHEASLVAAAAWLDALFVRYEHLEIHYLLGNHDCLDAFLPLLEERTARHPRFRYHADTLELGTWMFLHGDCTHARMHTEQFRAYRAGWRRDRPRGRWAGRAYAIADITGMTRLTHELYFPRRRTVGRVAHYLDDATPGWRDRIRDCSFGHSHLSFRDYPCEGIRYHNTGSAICGMGFQPIRFDAEG